MSPTSDATVTRSSSPTRGAATASAPASRPVIRVDSFAKTFSLGFRRTRVDAVRGVSFAVEPGEIFGLVGPNGAGKTTTIKAMMGLIRPSAGSISILGAPVPSVESRKRIGYLPEVSYYYEYLTPEEILDFYGRLYGLDRRTRRRRVSELLERVGLSGAIGKPLRKFSKGMLQRVGLAQALIADPDVVVLDEPQSGLDPIGRKEVADLIYELQEAGKTVFFSSHILPDVERVCNRVAVMIQGKIVDIGPLEKLLNPRTIKTEIALGEADPAFVERLLSEHEGLRATAHHAGWTLVVPGDDDINAILRALIGAGVNIDSVAPRRESLEDVFVREALGNNNTSQDPEPAPAAAGGETVGELPDGDRSGDDWSDGERSGHDRSDDSEKNAEKKAEKKEDDA